MNPLLKLLDPPLTGSTSITSTPISLQNKTRGCAAHCCCLTMLSPATVPLFAPALNGEVHAWSVGGLVVNKGTTAADLKKNKCYPWPSQTKQIVHQHCLWIFLSTPVELLNRMTACFLQRTGGTGLLQFMLLAIYNSEMKDSLATASSNKMVCFNVAKPSLCCFIASLQTKSQLAYTWSDVILKILFQFNRIFIIYL